MESWSSCFELNVTGSILFPCQEFGPAMCAAGKGSIVNIASVAGHLPLSRVVAYSAAKAAALNLTMFLAREWGRYGVRVNSITPGFFPAVQNRRLLFQEDGSPTPRAISILDHTPIGRFGEAARTGGRGRFPGKRRGERLRDGGRYPRGRRVPFSDDLTRVAATSRCVTFRHLRETR